jgi:hypothetical protein
LLPPPRPGSRRPHNLRDRAYGGAAAIATETELLWFVFDEPAAWLHAA